MKTKSVRDTARRSRSGRSKRPEEIRKYSRAISQISDVYRISIISPPPGGRGDARTPHRDAFSTLSRSNYRTFHGRLPCDFRPCVIPPAKTSAARRPLAPRPLAPSSTGIPDVEVFQLKAITAGAQKLRKRRARPTVFQSANDDDDDDSRAKSSKTITDRRVAAGAGSVDRFGARLQGERPRTVPVGRR